MWYTSDMADFHRDIVTALLENEDTSAFVLMTILINEFEDKDIFESETEVLFDDIERTFHIKLPEDNENKINAAITAMSTDLFYTNFDVFKAITFSLNEGDLGDVEDDDDVPTVPEIMWAIVEVALLNGTTFSETEFPKHMEDLINDVIDNEAEDKDEVDDEVDTIEEAMTEPYYQRYVTIKLLEVARDLLRLGVPNELVGELLASHNRSLDEMRDEY